MDAAKGMVLWARREPRAQRRGRDARALDSRRRAQVRAARSSGAATTYDGHADGSAQSYGRGPGGEVWKLENELYGLVEECAGVLSRQAAVLRSSTRYTTGLQPAVLSNMLRHDGQQAAAAARWTAEEIVLPVTAGGVLPCGASGRWQAND